MKRSAILAKLIFRPVVKQAAHHALAGRSRDRYKPGAGRFSHPEITQILDRAWNDFDRLAPSVPQEVTLGSRMNVLLACLTAAMLQAMIASGVERAYAIELIADACWKIYEQWGAIARLVSRVLTRKPVEQLQVSVNMFLRFPFNPPGYQFVRVPNDQGISVDMHRCPVAEYFRSRSAADLCQGTWCNLDYGLAEMWGGQLQRTGTLAVGDDHCDFEFKVFDGQ